jgi:PAS domain S-box-containing protein
MEDRLKSSYHLLEFIPTTFLLTDVHSRILYANRQAESFFGYGREELERQRIRILFLDEDLIYFLPNVLYLTQYKEGFDGEALLRQKGGRKIFVHLFTRSFREGGEVFFTFAFQEIQRLKNLQKERLELERWASLGRIVEEIAHQFRNPITSIGGFANRLLKGPLAAPKSRSYIERILSKTGRLEAILKRLEEYVRVPSPVLRPEKIGEVVEAAVSGLARVAKARGISLLIDKSGLEGDGQIFMDRKLMIKVLTQILENSLEAVGPFPLKNKKKEVEIDLFDDNENAGISISDPGQGITKKDLGLIFEPFFTTRPDRVGMGLTFVRRVMEEHEGKIQVESRLRKGTKVTLYFSKDRRRKVRRESIYPEILNSEAR